ncbi:hypothetical protein BGZ49_001566 [Haplosporangium sp. Z 27]|nr:hypothetical protein BGZ49_001566 [Haplosporangium sp. Z 27]
MKDSKHLLQLFYSCEVSDDSLTDLVTCIPSGKSSRTEVMGMYAHKYLVVLEAFLEPGMLSEGDMTEKGGVKLSREEMCEKTEGLRLESFIRGLFPSIKPILMPKALIRASRILIGARHLAGGYFEAIEMAGDIFGPCADYLESLETIRRRLHIIG